MPRTRRQIGDTSFSVAAPRTWNRLPTELKLLWTRDSFLHDLKTFLFHSVYGKQDMDRLCDGWSSCTGRNTSASVTVTVSCNIPCHNRTYLSEKCHLQCKMKVCQVVIAVKRYWPTETCTDTITVCYRSSVMTFSHMFLSTLKRHDRCCWKDCVCLYINCYSQEVNAAAYDSLISCIKYVDVQSLCNKWWQYAWGVIILLLHATQQNKERNKSVKQSKSS